MKKIVIIMIFMIISIYGNIVFAVEDKYCDTLQKFQSIDEIVDCLDAASGSVVYKGWMVRLYDDSKMFFREAPQKMVAPMISFLLNLRSSSSNTKSETEGRVEITTRNTTLRKDKRMHRVVVITTRGPLRFGGRCINGTIQVQDWDRGILASTEVNPNGNILCVVKDTIVTMHRMRR